MDLQLGACADHSLLFVMLYLLFTLVSDLNEQFLQEGKLWRAFYELYVWA